MQGSVRRSAPNSTKFHQTSKLPKTDRSTTKRPWHLLSVSDPHQQKKLTLTLTPATVIQFNKSCSPAPPPHISLWTLSINTTPSHPLPLPLHYPNNPSSVSIIKSRDFSSAFFLHVYGKPPSQAFSHHPPPNSTGAQEKAPLFLPLRLHLLFHVSNSPRNPRLTVLLFPQHQARLRRVIILLKIIAIANGLFFFQIPPS